MQFEAFPLDPWIANEILADLWAILGPSLGEVIGSVAGSGDLASLKDAAAEGVSWADRKLDPTQLSRGIAGLFQRTDAGTTRRLMEKLAVVTTVTNAGSPDKGGRLSEVFSTVFLGKPGAMYHWLAWSISVQFASVFGSIPAAIEWFGQRAALGQ
jgi:hypothetical protein